ncbi:hypothetical protein FKM82_008507 [Ascaphus truei]
MQTVSNSGSFFHMSCSPSMQSHRATCFYNFQPYSREHELRQIRDCPSRYRRKFSLTPEHESISEHPDEDEDIPKFPDASKVSVYELRNPKKARPSTQNVTAALHCKPCQSSATAEVAVPAILYPHRTPACNRHKGPLQLCHREEDILVTIKN